MSEKLNSFKDKLSKKRNSNQNKMVYSSEFDFYINTDYATYIQKQDDSYHSYTFQITRNNNTEVLENLFLSLQIDGSYKMAIITYDITSQEKINLANGLPIDLSNKITTINIEDGNLIDDIFSKIDHDECYNVIRDMCYCGIHDDITGYADCTCYGSEILFTTCPGIGTNDTSNDSSNNDNTTDTSSNNSDPNISRTDNDSPETTSPTIDPEFISDCEKLKIMATTEGILANFSTLKHILMILRQLGNVKKHLK